MQQVSKEIPSENITLSITTPTTTEDLPRMRCGGDEERILKLLFDCKAAHVADISFRLQKRPNQIRSAISRLRRKGFVRTGLDWKIKITDAGIVYYNIYIDSNNKQQQTTNNNNKQQIATTEELEIINLNPKKPHRKTIQYNFEPFLEKDGIVGNHRVVVEVFISRIQRGWKGWVVASGSQDLCKKLGLIDQDGGLIRYKINPDELSGIIEDLNEKNWIYKYPIPGSGGEHRVGIYENRLKEMEAYC